MTQRKYYIFVTHNSFCKKNLSIFIIKLLSHCKSYFICFVTHYSFFSAISNQKLFSPSKTYTLDGASFPVKNNVYYEKYKNFFTRNIKNNSIKNN